MEFSKDLKSKDWKARDIHFDLDKRLNRYIFPSQLHRFPRWISWWLGYRSEKHNAAEVGNVLVWWWSLFGAVAGLLVVGSTYRYAPGIQKYHPPVIYASFGASAILEYGAIHSPLAQPRNALFGHTLSAIIGVGIAKLFMLRNDYNDIQWVAAAVCCGVSSVVMGITNTIHPPGGATAVIAAIDPTARAMGWMFVPIILLGTSLITGVACLVNNIQRQFPNFWWTPADVGPPPKEDEEAIPAGKEVPESEMSEDEVRDELDEMKQSIVIHEDRLVLPDGLTLDWEEETMLQGLRDRLRELHGHLVRTTTEQSRRERSRSRPGYSRRNTRQSRVDRPTTPVAEEPPRQSSFGSTSTLANEKSTG